jgi:hypothetical protein
MTVIVGLFEETRPGQERKRGQRLNNIEIHCICA